MTDIGIPPRSKQDWDVPVARLDADVRALVARQRLAAGRAAEWLHQLDTGADSVFARLAVEHPEACASDASYPGWAERLAELIAKSDSTRKPGGTS